MTLKAEPLGCEDGAPLPLDVYIPCNQPAIRMIAWKNEDGTIKEGPYRMCELCAWHAEKRRGAVPMGPFVKPKVIEPITLKFKE